VGKWLHATRDARLQKCRSERSVEHAAENNHDEHDASTGCEDSLEQGSSVKGDDFKVFPRRKAGKKNGDAERAPVVVTQKTIQECFELPLHVASERLGICMTAIKRVCRKMGIKKWPYREQRDRAPAGEKIAGEKASAHETSCGGDSRSPQLTSVKQDDPSPERKFGELPASRKHIGSLGQLCARCD
jgi:hypothetical protein